MSRSAIQETSTIESLLPGIASSLEKQSPFGIARDNKPSQPQCKSRSTSKLLAGLL